MYAYLYVRQPDDACRSLRQTAWLCLLVPASDIRIMDAGAGSCVRNRSSPMTGLLVSGLPPAPGATLAPAVPALPPLMTQERWPAMQAARSLVGRSPRPLDAGGSRVGRAVPALPPLVAEALAVLAAGAVPAAVVQAECLLGQRQVVGNLVQPHGVEDRCPPVSLHAWGARFGAGQLRSARQCHTG